MSILYWIDESLFSLSPPKEDMIFFYTLESLYRTLGALSSTGLCFKYYKTIEIPKDAKVVIQDTCIMFTDKATFSKDKLISDLFKTLEQCKFALQLSGLTLPYIPIEYLTEELYKLAVTQDGSALKYVQDQTLDVCKIAVEKCSSSKIFVDKKFIHAF